jgi:hypothetical protein
MKIRSEQFEQMAGADDRLLLNAIKQIVLTDYQAIVEGLPEDLLDEMIIGGMEKARSFGLSRASHVAGFVLVMFEVGPEFYRHPEIEKILTDPDIPPDQRLSAMTDRTPPAAWDEVAASLAEQTWFPELRTEE